ncbi:MAG: signal peptidase II [Sulfurospirillaceae bacterium]|jgi:signal peptidase II|nr:signal peptidase II [Sulfurospirillaceae bacterium]MDD2825383.1 signal peptidase II [Sulfurospirillaceae bacterium]
MNKALILFSSTLIGIFLIDQSIKALFLEGFRWYGDFFSLILTFNKGVAFSMLAFLEGDLKYIQLALMVGIFVYLLRHKESFQKYSLPAGIIIGAGLSNVYDRFIHGGVVDYFFWHYGFEFAVFNFADVMIDCGVVMILYLSWKKEKIG